MMQQRPRYAFILIACVLATAGCSRLRGSNRLARRAGPAPAPPVISEGLDTQPVFPHESAYGPVPGVSVAPRGSTGFSRDIRYPRQRDLALQPGPIGRRPLPRTSSRNGAAQAPEIPVDVPSASRGDRSSNRATQPSNDAAVTRDETTGIPNFVIIEPNIATGGQPTYEGMQWLKDRGFRTVLNLNPADSADPAEAALVRQLGLEYIELPITPQSIQVDTVERFNQIADDETLRPLFIHDSTGSRSGAMWFLHRVTVDHVPQEQAQHQAARIGLKDTDTDFWLAINRYRSERP